MASTWWFFYQPTKKEDDWVLALGSEREKIVREKKPAFSTVLDLSAVPDDNDWTKVRYQGPLYFDFDADGDIALAAEKFKEFLAKLDVELDFDLTQARLFASGGKGFHIEIPEACFMPKVPANGTPWLPYIYRAVAESLYLDTLDLNVYTGKRGRMWRTTNVKRDNGNYKVPLALTDALSMTPELYAELIAEPRLEDLITPPSLNPKFGLMFERAREKVTKHMSGKKGRQLKANEVLDPYRKAKKQLPSVERLMNGDGIAEGVGFQAIAMQLAIYAASMGMGLPEFLERTKGLVDKHQGDGWRYKGEQRRRAELSRMHAYMSDNTFYDFEPGPMARLLREDVPKADLGKLDQVDHGDPVAAKPSRPTAAPTDADTSTAAQAADEAAESIHRNMRRGFLMNADGMFREQGEKYDSICRATFRGIEAFYDAETGEFRGYEFQIHARGQRPSKRVMLSHEHFTSAAKMRQFLSGHQYSYQGGDVETMSLLDVMAERAAASGRVYVYPREGFFVLQNPNITDDVAPVKVYLTQDKFLSSLPQDDPNYFDLRYKAAQATSAYQIDIHRAPELDSSMIPALRAMFGFNRDDVLASLLGWFVAAHYRSFYLHLFSQFPLLQVFGEAGSGKSQTIMLLAHLHWFQKDRISMKSAAGFTPFALDSHASSSTSAPLLIDEFKPRELKKLPGGKYERLKDVFKASYIGGDVGERGTVNKGAVENGLSIIKSKATAPIAFLGEAVEMETAIMERSVVVPLAQSYQTKQRSDAFYHLQGQPEVLSAIGRQLVELGFSINLESMRKEVVSIRNSVSASLSDLTPDQARAAPRIVYNKAIVIHGLRILGHVLRKHFGSEFDANIDNLLGARASDFGSSESAAVSIHAMSEVSKVINRIALLSKQEQQGQPFEVRPMIDYLLGAGWVELRVSHAYDQYRRYCATVHDTPLFDTLEQFVSALHTYSPAIDHRCLSSGLRQGDGDHDYIVRLDTAMLRSQRISSFRSIN